MQRNGDGAGAARRRIAVYGGVQGVGFRPFVYRVARELGLGGWVRNNSVGVEIEVEGCAADLEAFARRLASEAPPLATVERLVVAELPPAGDRAFAILASDAASLPSALVSPESATCADCLAELFDPADRRFRYPFINCTNCGPRFTIVRGVPFDRPLTTMAGFAMCAQCRSEYEDPADRRFHAQPNACPACGPSVRLIPSAAHPAEERPLPAGARDALHAAALALLHGAVVAVKGLGGYHLACRADDEQAVARLRSRKHREDKPFAIMVADLGAARERVDLDATGETLLTSRERPIVLAVRRPGAPVAAAVAPAHRELGVMLPYSPLHHLLLADAGTALVMTSGNVSDEPIAFRDDDALARLAPIADLFLLHDRPIETRTDDSVARVVAAGGARRPMLLRRSRGYVPAPLSLPVAASRPLLACGGQQKNTFCLVRGERAWLGPHVGDLENYETLRSFTEGIAHLEHLFAVLPERVAHDLHPDYLSTRYALDRSGTEPCGIQHHHAHLAACLAEHGETGPAIGAIFDGTGYGADGTVWGGEFLLGDLLDFERIGYLWPVRMPGGEVAVREPWRMACAWLRELDSGEPAMPTTLAPHVAPARWTAVTRLLRSSLPSPLTSSVGRLCDAASALCGVRPSVTYEGQAAIEFESLADPGEQAGYDLPILRAEAAAGRAGGADGGAGNGGGPFVLDGRVLFRGLLRDLESRVPVETIAARFHNGLADATALACRAAAGRHRVGTVVLSGGVFQNIWLLERTAARLVRDGLRVLVPERVPPNDGGIAYGQAAVAAAHLAAPEAPRTGCRLT